ncbi:helix-turn-helix domain-containing protein [Tsuneonella sp. YG55]|uniref:Helix-turn-helix domain-containing protein n=1 Tax=Tsuneonella litorea TaxID=2976475 RepID=A0A9X2W1W5_9SPHN|nr:helix-turn-helix domain-containing protein [Tsuneonella litorea]
MRAARALIGWTAEDLAEQSGVGWATIQRLETSDGVPPFRRGTLARVKATLETEGVEFVGDPLTSPGVRLRCSVAP